jgi:hypothetical protein
MRLLPDTGDTHVGRALGSDSPSVKPDSQSSSKLDASTGSGSRPGTSKVRIETSAPSNPHEIRPPPPGALK